MMKWSRVVVSIAVTLLLSLSAIAQTSRTTGALRGTVTDTGNNPMPGVTVTVTGTNLQGSRTAVTDAKGEYLLPTLPPGQYRAEYALSGIDTVVRQNVTVNLNQTTEVNVPMKLAVTETVTVTANQVVVDPTQTVQQQNFKQDHLKYAIIGSSNRSYQNVLLQAAAIAAPNGSGGGAGAANGNPQVSGANLAQNTYVLDGINTTDPVTHTFGPNMAFDAIQEISIQTLGKDAEYSSSGGTVNVVTKSGGNAFSGSFDDRVQSKALQSQGKKTHPTGIAYYGATPTGSALNFDKNLQPVRQSVPQATFGGPVLRDRLWFFAALSRPSSATTPPATQGFTPGTREFKGWDNIGKLTFTPFANQTLTALYLDDYASIPHAENNTFYSPEAGYTQTQGVKTYGLTYDSILSSRWLATVQGGHTPSRLAVLPNSGSAIAHINNNSGVRTANYFNAQGRRATRDELLANTTYYLEAFGTHAVKAGLDYNKNDFNTYSNASGDPTTLPGYTSAMCGPQHGFPAGITCTAYIIDQSGTTFLQLIPFNTPHTVASKQYAYFAQDEWNPISRLTIRGGLRYEQIHWNNPRGNNPPSFKMLQPRLGAAYDLFNNASSVIHGYAGRIMDDNQLTLVNKGYEQPTGTRTYRLDPATNTWADLGGTIFTQSATYASNLKPSYSNQASLGFTQRVWRNSSVDVTYEARNQKHLFEDYCGHLEGTTQIDLPNCVITNEPGFDIGIKNALRSDYHAVVTKFETRAYSWLDAVASWTHGSSKGSTESTQNTQTTFDYYPVFFANTYGYLSDDARNRVKVSGFVHLPLDFTVGANYYWDDGVAYTIFQNGTTTSATGVVFPAGYSSASYLIEPRGSRRMPRFSQTDLQMQKDFRISTLKLGLVAAVYNLWNTETPVTVNGNAGTRAKVDPSTGRLFIDPNQQTGANRLSPTFGQPISWQRPRRFEVGARIEF